MTIPESLTANPMANVVASAVSPGTSMTTARSILAGGVVPTSQS